MTESFPPLSTTKVSEVEVLLSLFLIICALVKFTNKIMMRKMYFMLVLLKYKSKVISGNKKPSKLEGLYINYITINNQDFV